MTMNCEHGDLYDLSWSLWYWDHRVEGEREREKERERERRRRRKKESESETEKAIQTGIDSKCKKV